MLAEVGLFEDAVPGSWPSFQEVSGSGLLLRAIALRPEIYHL
ncbi:MAG: hypothetical protein R2874_04460 [Desulfobacterales bacterium]